MNKTKNNDSLKFTNFLKYVIFYVKQLKFMDLAHPKGVLKVSLVVKVVSSVFGWFKDVDFCYRILTPNPQPPLGINSCSLNNSNHYNQSGVYMFLDQSY